MTSPAAGDAAQKAVIFPARANRTKTLDLDFEALLAIYSDEESLRLIAGAFLADADKELLLLDQAIAAGDQKKILACCHSLSGSSAIFTAKTLTAALKKLEACVRDGKKHETASAWRKVLAAHDSLRGYVASRLGVCP